MTSTCQYSYSPPHVPCSHPPLEGEDLCLFHSQNDKKDAQAFGQGLQEKLNKQDFDFEGYYFPPDLRADFSDKQFANENFGNAVFKGDAIFLRVEFFGDHTNFSGAKFSGERTYFSGAEFSGKGTYFRGAEFSGKGTYFRGAEFSGEVVFHSVGLRNCRFYDTDLRRVKFIRCDFASQEGYWPFRLIRQRLNLNPKASSGAGLLSKIDEKISLWTRRTDVLCDETDADEKREKDYALIARSYQQLKKYFQEEEKDYARAGEFFYGEMECKRKAGLHRPFLHLYWAFSGYGERYLRALLWLLFYIFILFPFLYYFTYNNAYVTKFDYDELRECYLYSLNVITLRGTEATQSFSFRLCSTLEMIFGLIQSALFFMALRSKLRR